MSQLFGFSLERAKKVPKGPSFVQKDSLDGSQPIVGGGYYGYSVDFDGTVRNDYELITRYREMVLQPECDSACLLYTSPSPRDRQKSRMPSSA